MGMWKDLILYDFIRAGIVIAIAIVAGLVSLIIEKLRNKKRGNEND